MEAKTDRERLDRVVDMTGGSEDALRDGAKEVLGTRDLDEADRRTRVIWERQKANG